MRGEINPFWRSSVYFSKIQVNTYSLTCCENITAPNFTNPTDENSFRAPIKTNVQSVSLHWPDKPVFSLHFWQV